MNELNAERHDGVTPEDRLSRYRRRVTSREAKLESGFDSTEALYTAAIGGLSDLLEAHGVDSAQERDIIIGQLLPGPFDTRELKLSDWVIQLQLIPMRLLDHDLPSVEACSDSYLDEVFATALPDETEHAQTCIDADTSDDVECQHALTCPARVSRIVALRRLNVQLFDLHMFDSLEQKSDIKRAEGSIGNMVENLKLYELIDDLSLGVTLGKMNKVARDFLRGVNHPKHLKSD